MSGDPGEQAGQFRAEVRDWLRAHVPAAPLPSVDTAEGFAAHRAWERELAAARLSVVSWPAAYGGRDASLLDWLVFEEEYYAAGIGFRPGLRPYLVRPGHRGQHPVALLRRAVREQGGR